MTEMRADRVGILARIIWFSLSHPGVVAALAVALLVSNVYTLTQAKLDVFPDFAPPQVSLRLEAPGLSPEQVEDLVTLPVERAVAGVEGVNTTRSHSMQGISAITIVFHAGTDVYRARQLVTERLASMSEPLPPGVTPFVSPLTSSAGTVLQVGLTSSTRSLMDLRTVADWVVKPRFLAAGGVAQVQVYGGELEQLQIQIQPDKLIQYDLDISDLVAIATRATGVVGGGFVEGENQRITLKTEGQSLTPAELAKTVVAYHAGASVLLGEVATVAIAAAPPIGAASINGQPGVVLLITEQYGANTLDVTRRLDQAIDELRPTLDREHMEVHADLFRPANYILTALRNVRAAMVIGGLLVIAVLILFLFNLRTATISAVAIPLSLVTAASVLQHLGFSLNIMVLGGLAVAVGEVVDDAIVDVENILRRLRANRDADPPQPVPVVILNAAWEVRHAVVFATFAVVLVFLPVLGISGVAGSLFAPLAIAYILAVLSSLVVALTVTPALSSLLLSMLRLPKREPPVVEWLKAGYQKLLPVFDARPRTVTALAATIVLGGVVGAFFLRTEFLPSLREGNFIVHVTAIPGTSLPESLRLGNLVSEELRKLPDVENVSQKTGRADRGSSTRGIGSSEIDASLKISGGNVAEFSPEAVRKVLAQYPGITYEVNTFLKERMGETLSGFSASVVVDLFSPDLDVLEATGDEIARALRATPGAVDVVVHAVPTSPQFVIRIRKDELVRWGLEPTDVLDAVQAAYQGATVGHIYREGRSFDVTVILAPEERTAVTPIGTLPLRNSAGTWVRLDNLTDIYETAGRYEILHRDGRRVQTVTCNVTGRTVESFVAAAATRIRASVALPAGSYLQFTGSAAAAAAAREQLLLRALLAALGILVLLAVTLGSRQNVLLVLLNLPFALVGGVMVLLASGTILSLGAMVGFVTLFGITLRNSLLMISHYEHLVVVEGADWSRETAHRGAAERLAPILMTATVTGLGLLPLVIGLHTAGREVEGPLALVILGGLVTSTVLNLLVLPTWAARWGRFERPGQAGSTNV
jgi:CzcA family heavy metal efflux pump